ncbi:MAG: glycosyltransferase family 9 protein, partial [Armatimonadetes bacterium]|nr:glycosyltransferase family 9 protein [Anaerolineae bacterium]
MPDRILLVQLADLGDLILTTPAIAALRMTLPHAHLTLLTTAHTAAVLPSGLVDAVITLERQQFNSSRALFQPRNLRRLWALGHYATIVYFHHFTLRAGTPKFALLALATRARRRIGLQNGYGWFLTESIPDEGFGAQHQADYWLKLVALLGADPASRPATVATAALELLDTQRPRIVIHAGGGGYSTARRWQPAHFATVANALHADLGASIVLVGGANDDAAAVKAQMHVPALDLTGQTSVAQLAGVLRTADVFIGAESGVLHLAAAVGVPLVAIFGPGNPAAWGAWTPTSAQITLQADVTCAPCMYVGHSLGLREGCAARTCLKLITPEQVITAAKALLGDTQPSPLEIIDERVTGRGMIYHAPTATPGRITLLGLPVVAMTYPA